MSNDRRSLPDPNSKIFLCVNTNYSWRAIRLEFSKTFTTEDFIMLVQWEYISSYLSTGGIALTVEPTNADKTLAITKHRVTTISIEREL